MAVLQSGEATKPERATWSRTLLVIFGPSIVGAISTLLMYGLFHYSSYNLYFSDYVFVIELIYLLFIAVLWKFLKSEKDGFRRLLAYDRNRLRRHLWIGFLTFLGGFGIIIAYTLVYSLVIPGVVRPSLPRLTAVFTVTIGAASAGFVEEFIWRGYGITRLEVLTKSPWKSILISSLGFGFWHLNPFNIIYTFLVGLFFGWVYTRQRSLVPLVLGHWLTDFVGFLGYLT
jgi:membrane protease YdiL (CAAX protease family)